GYPFSGSSNYGQWSYTRHRYLGLKFIVSGQVHYGWARVAVTLDQNKEIVATLTGYAYETIPNKPIIAGKTKGPDVITWEPATLGRLAQGASGISAWREKKEKLLETCSTISTLRFHSVQEHGNLFDDFDVEAFEGGHFSGMVGQQANAPEIQI